MRSDCTSHMKCMKKRAVSLTLPTPHAYTTSITMTIVLIGWPISIGRIGKPVQIRRSRATVTGERLILS